MQTPVMLQLLHPAYAKQRKQLAAMLRRLRETARCRLDRWRLGLTAGRARMVTVLPGRRHPAAKPAGHDVIATAAATRGCHGQLDLTGHSPSVIRRNYVDLPTYRLVLSVAESSVGSNSSSLAGPARQRGGATRSPGRHGPGWRTDEAAALNARLLHGLEPNGSAPTRLLATVGAERAGCPGTPVRLPR